MVEISTRTIIITGGNRGIGESIARAFHRDGYHVLIGGRKDTGLAHELGERARFAIIDVRIEADHNKLTGIALEWTGSLDCYVNNAGFSGWRPIQEIDDAFFYEMIDTNLKGTLWGCKAASAHLSSSGSIINISSIAGKRGSVHNSVYCASKFGVNGITQSLAKELGPRGIRVNAVCPVLIKTHGLVEALQDPRSPVKGGNVDAFFQSFAASQSALGRLPTAEEVGNVCVFLASEKASAITGQCLNVDCGVFPQ